MAEQGSLSGRTALVTGSATGLGRAIAEALARAGAHVGVHGRHEATVQEVVRGIDASGGTAAPVVGDFSAGTAAVQEMFAEAVARLGPLDLLINNAADQRLTPAAEENAATWREVLEVNLLAAVELTRLICTSSDDRAAVSIVNVTSVEGLAPFPGHAAYAASKAALHAFTASAAGEWAPARVNAVAPGLIERAGLQKDWPQGWAFWEQSSPLGRPVTASEVAEAVVFLASPMASGITGVTLPVDAGWASAPRTTWGSAQD